MVLNRVFNRDDVPRPVFHLMQQGVERRGFAAAGRPGGENQALRLFDEGFVERQLFRGEAEPGDIVKTRGAVENADDDLFALVRDDG